MKEMSVSKRQVHDGGGGALEWCHQFLPLLYTLLHLRSSKQVILESSTLLCLSVMGVRK